jgi:hypothetical protein
MQKHLALTAFVSKPPGPPRSKTNAYEVTERGVKVSIKAAVQDTWIRDLPNPETFYSNITALALVLSVC